MIPVLGRVVGSVNVLGGS